MKFVSHGLPLVCVDEKFLFYTNIVDRMDATERHHDVGPIRINLGSLINSVRAHAIEWQNTLGKILTDETKANIKDLCDHMIVSESNFRCNIFVTEHLIVIGIEDEFASKHKRIR